MVSETYKCSRSAGGVSGDPDAERAPGWTIHSDNDSGGIRAQTRRHQVSVPTESGPQYLDSVFSAPDLNTAESHKGPTKLLGGPSVETAPSDTLRVGTVGVNF